MVVLYNMGYNVDVIYEDIYHRSHNNALRVIRPILTIIRLPTYFSAWKQLKSSRFI